VGGLAGSRREQELSLEFHCLGVGVGWAWQEGMWTSWVPAEQNWETDLISSTDHTTSGHSALDK
jgi:hypothetical protein